MRDSAMEQPVVSGVVHDASEAKVTVFGVPDRPGVAARIFEPLAEAGIVVDLIVQNVSSESVADVSFTVSRLDLARAVEIAGSLAEEIGAAGVDSQEKIAKVAIVGGGMRSHPGVAARMFATLADAGINIEMISTSPVRVSCVVAEDRVEEAVRRLHEAFEPPMMGQADG